MSKLCNYCVNKENCSECDKKGWHEKFIPNKNVSKYFSNGFNGVRGYDGKHTWSFNTTNPLLKETHSILIEGNHYCPYCGELMFSLQQNIDRYHSYSISGYCCICDGALAEIKYEEELVKLEDIHKEKIRELKNNYKELLSFNNEKLFKTKQIIEKNKFESRSSNCYHFSTMNGEKYYDINQIL